MAWGLPPKFEIVKELNTPDIELIKNNISLILEEKGFIVQSVQRHDVQARKKLSHTALSIASFGRPSIHLSVLITKKGRLTIKSYYTYNSRMGDTCFDFGKQKKIILPIIEKLTDSIK